MNINANMKSVHSITGIPGSKKKRLPKNSGVFLLVSDSHTLGFPNPERLRRSEVCRMDIYQADIFVRIFCQEYSGAYFLLGDFESVGGRQSRACFLSAV